MTATTIPAWATTLPETMPDFLFADFGDPDNRKQDVKPGLFNLLLAHMDKWTLIRSRCSEQGIDPALYDEAHQAVLREVRIEAERMAVHDALLAVKAHASTARAAIDRLTGELADEDTRDATSNTSYVRAFLDVLMIEVESAHSMWPFDENANMKS